MLIRNGNKFGAKKMHWCLDCNAGNVIKEKRKWFCLADKKHEVVCFDSAKEHKRYLDLRILEDAGKIKSLQVHPKYEFEINGVKIGTYTCDLRYWVDGEGYHIEDAKGYMNAPQKQLFDIKCKLMKALYGIEVQVV